MELTYEEEANQNFKKQNKPDKSQTGTTRGKNAPPVVVSSLYLYAPALNNWQYRLAAVSSNLEKKKRVDSYLCISFFCCFFSISADSSFAVLSWDEFCKHKVSDSKPVSPKIISFLFSFFFQHNEHAVVAWTYPHSTNCHHHQINSVKTNILIFQLE